MKNARHLFVLIGFLAQSLTWDSYIVTGIAFLLWILSVTRFHHKFPLTLKTEALALILGCVASVAISKVLQRSAHFFIGDGLVALQLIRLLRPLNRREKLTSVVIACFHIGVLCTLAPDLRFVVLFLGALYLLPGALKEPYHDRKATPYTSRRSPRPRIQFVPTMRVCLWLLLGSVFVFLSFPRFTGSPLQLRDGFDQASLLDTILDPRRGGRANSQQVLLQIEGIDVGYLRCFALTEFDGIQWKADKTAKLRLTPWLAKDEVAHKTRFLPRKVYVKNANYLGRIVPVDGRAVYMEQSFFTHPGRNVMNDALECHSMWTGAKNTYEYFIDTRPEPTKLPADIRARLLFAPLQSERLQSWLANVTRNGTNALHKARILENYLRSNYRYEIGTPELSRLSPTEDFIFNRKEGHCERFAASMALFLRMQGIPSRVAIGYVPTSKNMFTDRAQVRFRDAHSWTEGYFDGHGWVTFDATPGPPPGTRSSDLLDILEEVEFAWYSHVVNFNGFAQRDLLSAAARALEKVPRVTWQTIALAMVVLLTAALALKRRFKFPALLPHSIRKKRKTASGAARHYYDELLQAFQKRGIDRTDGQTPKEFLEHLREKSSAGYSEATIVTDHFCRSFYGQQPLTPEQQTETKRAIDRLKHVAAAPACNGSRI